VLCLSIYHINDQWVLNRVSKESSSFKNWVEGIIKIVQKELEEDERALEQFKKSKKELPDLVSIEEKIKKAQEALNSNAIRFGSLSGFISKLTKNIQTIVSEKLGCLSDSYDTDLSIDFLTGKRKNLADSLYDVAQERGINSSGILFLIKSLPDLESFLYSTSAGKFYRDHTEHQLRVAVLGDFILEQDFGNGQLLNIISELAELDKAHLKDKIWWVMGLLHDIGYPLQKMSTSINYALLNQILKCYPMLDLQFTPFEISLTKEKSEQIKYLKILEEGLSKKAKELIRAGSGLYLEEFPKPKVQTSIASSIEGHQVYKYLNPIGLDHGVIGGLSLLRSLGTPEELQEQKEEYTGYLKAAQAIALHNFKDPLPEFTFDNNPLAFLLVLIDEMQEWGRPIPIQIRESFFTTELKKITLLDEIVLSVEEAQWLMSYRNMRAKELSNFQFQLFCDSKRNAFTRVNKGKSFLEQRIVLQDYEVATNGLEMKKALRELLAEQREAARSKKKKKSKAKVIKTFNLSKEKEREQPTKHSLFGDVYQGKTKERLLAEFYIVI